MAHVHELEPEPAPDEFIQDEPPVCEAEPEASDTFLINTAKGSHPHSLQVIYSDFYLRTRGTQPI
jgi:hypothetical protein